MRFSHNDPIDVELRFRFFPKTGQSVAVSDGEEVSFPPAPLIFLPLSEISMYPENPEAGDVITITMPQWLAEKNGLV